MPPAYEVLLLNTAVPQIQAAQSGDTYVVPRDIAFSAALTLSAGTANGVPYLNGSKVLTTGSALTFDGTKFGINTASPLAALHVIGDVIVGLNSASTNVLSLTNGGLDTVAATVPMKFSVNGSEQMRLTGKAFMVGYTDDSGFTGQYNAAFSGNVGIGTSSSLQKLTIQDGNILLRQGSTDSQNQIAFTNGYGRRQGITFVSDGSVSNTSFGIVNTQTALLFQTAAYNIAVNSDLSTGWTERMRLDSSGNLGIGVTPSAWSLGKAFEITGVGNAIWSPNAINDLRLISNIYYNGGYKYAATGYANMYQVGGTNGTHSWYNAASGTAGNAISFTQALTLDANRNLLLNGTSAGASAVGTLAIFNGTAPTGSVTDGIILYAEDVSSSSELKVRDEAGNVTTLSPHNFSLIPEGPSEDMAWAYYSEKGGKRINVDMLKLARMVEKLTGEKLVYEA